MKSLFTSVLICLLFLVSCSEDEPHSDEVVEPGHYTNLEFKEISKNLLLPRVPDEYQGDFFNAMNAMTTLGWVLFYDKNLSVDVLFPVLPVINRSWRFQMMPHSVLVSMDN